MAKIRQRIRERHLAEIQENPLEGARTQLEGALQWTDGYTPLIGELVDEDDWTLRPAIRFRSQRPVSGKLLIFIKRRIVFPIVYWLYEFCAKNFRVQKRVNVGLMALIETLAQENARLRSDMERVLGRLGELSGESQAQPTDDRE